MNQKGSVAVALLIGLIVILGGALGYMVLMQQASKSDVVVLPQDDSEIFTPPTQKTAATAVKPAITGTSGAALTADEVLNAHVPAKFSGVGATKENNGTPIAYTFKNGESPKIQDGPSVTLVSNMIVIGDLHGDGKKEAAVPYEWCWASCGRGLYIIAKIDGKAQVVGGVNLGKDSIQKLKIANGFVVATVMPQIPADPASPVPVVRTYRWDGETAIEIMYGASTQYKEILASNIAVGVHVPLAYADMVKVHAQPGSYAPPGGGPSTYRGVESYANIAWHRYDFGDGECKTRTYVSEVGMSTGAYAVSVAFNACKNAALPSEEVIRQIMNSFAKG